MGNLANVLVQRGGYGMQDALNAENGPRAAQLAQEFGVSLGGAAGVPAPFNFDYAGEATKAYGELGSYYDRILKESKGDMNLALARLKEDYETGTRIRKEDLGQNQAEAQALDTEAQRRDILEKQGVVGNALDRGLYQKSAFEPAATAQPGGAGYGIPDTNMANLTAAQSYASQGRANTKNRLLLNDTRAADESSLLLGRKNVDINQAQTRFESEQERQRRLEAAQLADTRGQRAYTKWSSSVSMV